MRPAHSIQEYVDVVRDGVHKHSKAGGFKKRVIVVGAGLAGLSAAYELLQAGHEPLILEAQHRVGGRIHTLREPFARGLYGESGAMRSRFWETEDGIHGGGTVTDMAIRNLYYTDYGRETGRGILLVSYTWSEDAQRWGSLLPHERIEQALENVAVIHPQIREEFESGASRMWHDDPFAGGAFALFDPG